MREELGHSPLVEVGCKLQYYLDSQNHLHYHIPHTNIRDNLPSLEGLFPPNNLALVALPQCAVCD